MRHLREIKDLPVSELTDEEIVKAAMHRLGANAAMLVYSDENQTYFIGRYRKGGRMVLRQLQSAWEERFGKLNRIEQED